MRAFSAVDIGPGPKENDAAYGEGYLRIRKAKIVAKKRPSAGQRERPKGGWMRRRCCLPSRSVRRARREKSLGAAQAAADQFVLRLAVDVLAGEPGHDRFHDTPDVFFTCGTSVRNRLSDRLLDCRGVGRRGKISLQHFDLGGFLLREVVPS